MNLQKLILTNNACYKAGKTITPKGIMVHSTGANNPNLKRYVGPDDGLLGKNQYNNHWNQAKPDGRQVCVHAFIGKLANGSIATYQTLPWNMRGWHSGSGTKGSANDKYIGFEICEDGLTDPAYFGKVYKEAVELCANLCKMYGLDPKADGVLICHSEGYKRGIASNHGDVMHWFPKHGKSMDTFRAAVAAEMTGAAAPATPTPTPETPAATGALAVGDVVDFTGTTHYTSSAAIFGKSCKAGKAKITQIAAGAKHPYHLVSVSGGGSTVHGWVNATAIAGAAATGTQAAQTIKAGSVVRLKTGAKTYTGGKLAAFVYNRNHTVKEVKGDRVVIAYLGITIAAVKLSDLTLVKA